MVENCPYAKELKVKIEKTSDFREKTQLQIQYFSFINPLLCGKGPDLMICCNFGKKLATLSTVVSVCIKH